MKIARISLGSLSSLVAVAAAAFFVSIPFERIGSIDIAGFTVRLSQIILIALIVLILTQYVVRRRTAVLFPTPLVAYLLFIAADLLSLIHSMTIERSVLVLLLHIFMLFVPLVIVAVCENRKKYYLFIRLLIMTSVIVCLFGLFQFFGDIVGLPQSITGLSDRYIGEVLGIPRIQSTFIEPLYFANFLLIPLSLSIALFIARKKDKKIFLALGILFLACLVLSVSKGGIAAAVVSIACVALLMMRRLVTRQNSIYMVLIGVVVALSAWAGSVAINRQVDFFSYFDDAREVLTGGSVIERQESFLVAWDAFQTSPIVGIGVGSYGAYFSGYQTQAPDYGWPIVNNQYLEVMAETGMVGLITFLLFIFSVLLYGLKTLSRAKDLTQEAIIIGLIAALVGTLAQFMTFSTLYVMHIWVGIGLILAAGYLYGNNDERE